MKPTPLTWALRVAMVLLVVSAGLAWVAVGKLGDTMAGGLEQTSVALNDAIKLADSTAKIAEEMQATVISVALGMQTASEAIGNVISVSANVRSLLGLLSIVGRVDSLRDSLADAEASLAEAQGGLEETKNNVIAAEPAIADAVTVLEAVPGQLREATAKIDATADRVDDYVALSRLFIVLLAIAMMTLFFAVERMSRAEADSAEAGEAQP